MADTNKETYVLASRYGEYVAGDGERYSGASEVSKTEAEKINKADGGGSPVFVPKHKEVS